MPSLLHKKIAVLGGSTTNEIVEQMENFLLHYGISAEFYQSGYGQYWQDAVFGSEGLDGFSPDFIYIHTNWRNIEVFPQMEDSREAVGEMLEKEYARFVQMWDALREKFSCPIIQNNFERPNYRLLGNRDIWDYRGRSNYISRLNQKLYQYAEDHEDFYVNDLEYLSQDYGLSEWNAPLYWYMYKYAMCMDAIPYVAQSVANIIKSILGKNKKVLALDLDNTLWGGVVGDDGVEGIKIGPEVPAGQVYAEFQEYCGKLKEIGVVLTVDSKNDLENALAGLEHPDGRLRPGDFVAIKANWNQKDQNIRETADELSLGMDSFVFVDDNPAEREVVSAQLPMVAVPEMHAAEDYIKVLDHSGYFEPTVLSEEDGRKTELYQAKAEAVRQQKKFTDYGEYLKSLRMTAYLQEFTPVYIQRIAQLTNKTNQFNLTALRCTEDDIKAMQASPTFICFSGRLVDKFADNGLVAVTAAEKIGDELHIRLWLMSCRVLKRSLEDAMMNHLVEKARECGVQRILGYYCPTPKNSMVKDFYAQMGFHIRSEDDGGNAVWEMEVAAYSEKEIPMELVRVKP